MGYTKTGEAMMRAWQVRGGSASCEKVVWKLMRLADAIGAVTSEEPASGPRKGYKRGDPALERRTLKAARLPPPPDWA